MEEIVFAMMILAIFGTGGEILAASMTQKNKQKKGGKKVKKITRKDVTKLIAKKNYCSKFIAEDICDNLEQELRMFYDGWHFKPSVQVIIADYFEIPKNWSIDGIIKAILD